MDDLTSVPTETSTSGTPPTGQAPQTSQETSTTPQPQSENGSTAPAIDLSKINLHDLPQYRNVQSQFNQTLSAVNQRAYAAEQRLLEAQMAGMDDLEKAEFRAQQLEAIVQQRHEQDEYNNLLQMRAAKIYTTAEKYKVPVEVIQFAQSPDEMYEVAMAYKDQQVEQLATKRAAEIRQLQEHDKVDLGSGSYTNPREQRIANAIKAKDTTAYYAALLAES